jgi:hypothetical protein
MPTTPLDALRALGVPCSKAEELSQIYMKHALELRNISSAQYVAAARKLAALGPVGGNRLPQVAKAMQERYLRKSKEMLDCYLAEEKRRITQSDINSSTGPKVTKLTEVCLLHEDTPI